LDLRVLKKSLVVIGFRSCLLGVPGAPDGSDSCEDASSRKFEVELFVSDFESSGGDSVPDGAEDVVDLDKGVGGKDELGAAGTYA